MIVGIPSEVLPARSVIGSRELMLQFGQARDDHGAFEPESQPARSVSP